ncbi:MAG TPA: ferritin-like domain-containing protein, partial [Thermoguttaceae bacterium]|nr:ferritin-like domain-containing protein [Thermoguttaceae bacterium]
MLSAKMQQALNEQINAELYSSYLYLAMAAHSEAANFHGFGHWLRIQAEEEHGHAMKIFDFVLDRGGRVELKPIQGP